MKTILPIKDLVLPMMEVIDEIKAAKTTAEALSAVVKYNNKLETLRNYHESISKTD